MAFLTFLTDFGIQDGYVAAMKGVVWQIAPETRITDITHLIPHQDVFAGSYLLARTAPYFPAGTVHVAVVDPGVGTARRPMAARVGSQYFVGPDNGLITFFAQQTLAQGETCEYVHLTKEAYWLPDVSRVFHGRDIFAPSGAHLSRGVPLLEMGERMDDPILFDIPQVQVDEEKITGSVVQVDHFGNLSTNIHESLLEGKLVRKSLCCGVDFGPLVGSFGDKMVGDWAALIDSNHHLSLNVVNGSAAEKANAKVGDRVELVHQKTN